MPHKLRTLSGDQLVRFFQRFGFFLYRTRGSHMKMIRNAPRGNETLIIPRNVSIPKGTLKTIYNQALRFIEKEHLDKFFYTE